MCWQLCRLSYQHLSHKLRRSSDCATQASLSTNSRETAMGPLAAISAAVTAENQECHSVPHTALSTRPQSASISISLLSEASPPLISPIVIGSGKPPHKRFPDFVELHCYHLADAEQEKLRDCSIRLPSYCKTRSRGLHQKILIGTLLYIRVTITFRVPGFALDSLGLWLAPLRPAQTWADCNTLIANERA